jgi:hypothetical protein
VRSALFALALLGLAACGRAEDAPRLSIASAHVEPRGDALWLVADCRWEPSAAMLEGLDHGIALTLDVKVSARNASSLGWISPLATSQHHLELRYFPLTRQYQWRDPARGGLRSYALRSTALSALERLELPLPSDFPADAPQLGLRIRLDTDALPGALHVPALVQTAWRQRPADFVWTGRPG